MLGQRRRRWSNIKPALGQRLVFIVLSHNMDSWHTMYNNM